MRDEDLKIVQATADYIKKYDQAVWEKHVEFFVNDFRDTLRSLLGLTGKAKKEKQVKPTPEAYKCDSCDHVASPDDVEESNPLYECTACGEIFTRERSMDGASHKCPECSKFGTKKGEIACPECEEGCMRVLIYAEG